MLFVVAGIFALVSRQEMQHVTPGAPQTVASVKDDIREVKDARHDRQ